MTSLLERHQELTRTAGPLRARDAAERLGTTEAALVACGATGRATPLRPDWPALIGALPRAGRVMALTRNDHAVHERHGTYTDVSSGPAPPVAGAEIDLRCSRRVGPGYAWRRAASIQVFDRARRAQGLRHRRHRLAAWKGPVATSRPRRPRPRRDPRRAATEAEREVDAAAAPGLARAARHP